jgi:hypothetical protein
MKGRVGRNDVRRRGSLAPTPTPRKERYGTIASAFRFLVASLVFACCPRRADSAAFFHQFHRLNP